MPKPEPAVGKTVHLHISRDSSVGVAAGRYHKKTIHVRRPDHASHQLSISNKEHLWVEIVATKEDEFIAEPVNGGHIFQKGNLRGTKNDLLTGHK